jgi:hypothetical protein
MPITRPTVEDVKSKPEWAPYAKTFSRLMTEFGGWSKDQAQAHLDSRLLNPGFRSWFPHDNPSHEAAPLLLPADLRDSLEGPPWVKLRERICEAIDRKCEEHNSNPDNDPQYDWEAARKRIAQVVEDFRRANAILG